MINAITPETLYLLLPSKVSQMAIIYARQFGVSTIEAVRAIYRSNTYKELEREETKLWHLGPVALMEYMAEHN